MKQRILFIGFLIGFSSLFGQQSINLNLPHDGNTGYYYEARDYITMQPMFSYDPVSPNTLVAKVNEDMVLPVEYTTEPISVSSRELNYNLPVGTTTGSQSVNLTGAATYQIPLVIPPGTAGMIPGISLAYNSQAGNGLLGYGWNIAGLSAITRVGHTIYHDGEVKGVDFDDDRFALDGNRMIYISGTNGYGGDESVYYTEMFNASRITSMGTAGNGPEHFVVETKDGKIIEYGNTIDSRFIAQGKTDVLVWNINRIEDRMGNFIEFEYHKEGQTQQWIKEIRYTGNDNENLQPYNRIHFYYSERDDNQVAYIAGSKVESKVLLDKIKVYAGNSIVRKYKLNYHYDFYSHLIEVEEYGSDGSRYNSTIFQWEANNPSYVYGQDYNQDSYKYFAGDFNGDGKSDIIAAHYYYYEWVRYFDSYKIYDGANQNVVVDYGSLGNYRDILVGDYNGDGISDVIFTYRTEYSNYDNWYYFKWISVEDGFGFDKSTFSFIVASGVPEDEYPFKSIDIGDFDGDLQDDIIFNLQTDYSTSWIVHIMTDSFEDIISRSSITDNSGLKIADFNGNGKSDIMIFYQSDNHIYECDESNNFVSIFLSTYPSKDHDVFTGDFNGDGKADVLTWSVSAGWEMNYFTQDDNNSFKWQQIAAWPGIKNTDPNSEPFDNNYHVADFNGDGKADILEYYNNWIGNNATTSTYNIFYFNGSSFDTYSINDIDMTALHIGKDLFGDFNGDGNLDIISGPDQSIYRKIIYFNIDKPIHSITDIEDGFNNNIHFQYLPITNTNVYTRYADAFTNSSGHLRDMQSPFYVVYQNTTNNGIGGETTTSYTYEGARIHRYGKGFLGFQKISTSHKIEGTVPFVEYSVAENIYDNPGPYYNLVLVSATDKIKTIQPPPGLPVYETLSETFFVNNNKDGYDLNSNLIILPYIAQSVSVDKLKNDLTITTDYIVDDYGNIITQTIGYNDIGTKTATTTYTNKGSWCDYLPNYISITQTRTGEIPITRNTDYDYYANGLLKELVTFHGLPIPLTKHIDYDGFGNILSTTVTAQGETSRTSSIAYDNKGRFAISSTNGLSHTSHFISDHKTGLILNATDISGLVTSNKYDAFGRLVQIIYPNGNKSDYSLHWDQNNIFGDILYYAKTKTDGEPEAKIYYDLFGREQIKAVKQLNGSFTATKNVYNSNGQVQKVSEPYMYGASSPSKWTEYRYRADGRLETILLPNNETTTYTYNGLTTSVYNSGNGITNTKTIDAFGLTVSASDPGGTLVYAYYSSGQPKTISAPPNPGNPNNIVFEMHYDAYDRQEWLDDPDAGKTEYGYSGFGELNWQKDEEGNEFTMGYDNVGRLKTKTASDGYTVTYEYVAEGNGLEKVSSVSHSNGINFTYSYDDFNRITAKTETIDGSDFKTSYTYDGYGNTNSITYPSGFKMLNNYNDKGYLVEVKRADNNEVLYGNSVYNVRGQLTNYNLGNGLQTDRGFNSYGLPTSITTGYVQDLEYEFDAATGNLNWRKDNIFALQETFGYSDALKNRLTSWQVGTQINTAAYMLNGNIVNKSDLGSYAYQGGSVGAPGGPHAVTEITDPVNLPAEADQIIHYNVFNKVEHIEHQTLDDDYYITYGPGQARKKTELKHNGTTLKTKYYIGGYEKEINSNGDITETHYIPGGDGLLALYIIKNGTGTLYYAHKDHLGSLYALTDENGDIAVNNGQAQRFNFDPWGRRRNPTDWTFNNVPNPDNYLTDRGFTGHQHLDLFGLVNMNGRMYDPLLGRMLSPDNYVQSPGSSQGYNRYTYANNNPLVYTDPSGEFLDLAFFAMAMTADYLSNLINGVQDPLGTAYNNVTTAMSGINNCLQYPVFSNENTTITAGISPFTFGVSVNAYHKEGDFGFGLSAGIGMFPGTGSYISGSASYTSGDFTFTAGGGYSSHYTNWMSKHPYSVPGGPRGFSGISYYDRSNSGYFSLGATIYGGTHAQSDLYVGYKKGDFSLGISNDIFSGDKFRTAAVELGVGDFSLGWNLYTTAPPEEEYQKGGRGGDKDWISPIYGKPKNGTYSSGSRIYAGLYIGFRNGSSASRIGINAPWVQDFGQNGIHTIFGFPYFNTNYGSPSSIFVQGGGIFPYSLYLH